MLEETRENIARLIALFEAQRQRADSLEADLSQCKARIEDYRMQITDLNQQIDNLKLQIAFSGGADNCEAKERIERMIREIDKCIKLLEK